MHNTIAETAGLILHFRTPQKTMACIHSLIKNGLKQIILIDNSEDQGHSLLQMQSELAALKNQDIKIFILSSMLNQGFAKAVNQGIDFAKKNEISNVLLINSDAQLEENSLYQMHNSLSNSSICIPRVKSKADNTPSSLFGFYQKLTGFNFSTAKVGCLKYASGCCLLIKINDFTTPLLDEGFFFYGEDVEFSYRCKQSNIQIIECMDAFIIHEGTGSSKNGSFFYEYHINLCHLLLAYKLARNPLELFLFIVVRCISLPLRATIRCVKNHSFTAWHGLLISTFDLLRGKCRGFTPPIK
jgi:N-acetylglucosaminyl-diphospho-decaprenol L-rhamnosyltransferase